MTTEEKLVREYQKAQKKLVQIIMKKQAHGSAAAYERSLLRQIQKELKKLKKTSKAAVQQLVRENYKTGLQSLINDIIKDASAPKMHNAMSGLNVSQIDIIVQNTNASLNNVINLVGRQIQDVIREAGVEATAEKLTTGQTVREMQKNLEQKLKEQDITSVKYRNGKRVSIHKYAAMVARSTTAETQNKAKTVQGEEWGYDLVRFTKHSPTCKVCSMYQGRVYALTKAAANGKYKGSKGQALHFPYLYDTALPHGYSTIHPNCQHRLSVLPAGAYTAAEMEEFSQKSTQPFEDMRSDKERKEYAKEQEIKRKRNAARRQYEEIKATLPNEAPKTFAGFIKMKTAKSERYKELLEDYKAVIGIAKQQESGIIIAAESAERNTGRRLEYNPKANFDITIDTLSENVNKGINAAIKKVTALGGNDGFEHLSLIDLDTGNEVYSEDSIDSMSVGGSEFWKFIREHPEGKYSFVHNHNTDGCFSETDMSTLLRVDNIQSFIAARIDGVVYYTEKSTPFTDGRLFDSFYADDMEKINIRSRKGEITPAERTRERETMIVNNLLRDFTKNGVIEFDGRK